MRRLSRGALVTSVIFLMCFVVVSCSHTAERPVHPGEKLATTYCASCHELPTPDALSKDLWQQILPRMGARMGIAYTMAETQHLQELRLLNLQLDASMISKEDWDAIQAFYLSYSPDTLPAFKTQISQQPLDWFRAEPLQVSPDNPAASLVKFATDSGGIYYGDALQNKLHYFDLARKSTRTIALTGAPSDLLQTANGLSVLTMGDIFPNDLAMGQLVHFSGKSDSILLSGLPRPVRVKEADLNGDGIQDLLVCGFGHLKGSLSWFEQTNNGYVEHSLRNEPGAINAEVTDLNNDGHNDILALMAQGREGFFVYLGNGKGGFQEKQIYSFPSYYGSSYFELADMNSDGQLDIVYANGDTGDYDYPALKPYHGIRILLQEGILEFTEAYTFPIHGPFNTMAEDYDLDGDIDLAVTSFFPDYTQTPGESFLILENQGKENFSFIARALASSASGKWLSADRADFDQDGDIDILLGNGPVMRSRIPDSLQNIWRMNPTTVLLLENTTID